MANSEGTPGGVGSSQGGQQGWEDGNQSQPIPPSREGTTSAGMTGTVYDPSVEVSQMANKTKTDAERKAEEGVAPKEGEARTYPAVDTDPTDPSTQPNFGLPEGVTTSQTRGENDTDEEAEPVNPEGEPNPTVEEQLGTAPADDEGDLKEG